MLAGSSGPKILKEIDEVENITLVCKKHGIKRATVMNWIHRVKAKIEFPSRSK